MPQPRGSVSESETGARCRCQSERRRRLSRVSKHAREGGARAEAPASEFDALSQNDRSRAKDSATDVEEKTQETGSGATARDSECRVRPST